MATNIKGESDQADANEAASPNNVTDTVAARNANAAVPMVGTDIRLARPIRLAAATVPAQAAPVALNRPAANASPQSGVETDAPLARPAADDASTPMKSPSPVVAPHTHELTNDIGTALRDGNSAPSSALSSAGIQTMPAAFTNHTAALPSVQQPATIIPVPVPLNALAIELGARVHLDSNRFDIRLDPPELGRIDVHLHVDAHGQVTSHVIVDRADTLDLLQRDASDLRQSLQQAGLKTGDNGLQFSLRDQSFNGNGSNAGHRTAPAIVPDAETIGTEVATRSYTRAGQGSGVDIRV